MCSTVSLDFIEKQQQEVISGPPAPVQFRQKTTVTVIRMMTLFVWFVCRSHLQTAQLKLEDIGTGGFGKDGWKQLCAGLHLWGGQRVGCTNCRKAFFKDLSHQMKCYLVVRAELFAIGGESQQSVRCVDHTADL